LVQNVIKILEDAELVSSDTRVTNGDIVQAYKIKSDSRSD